jgi:hypothetical protein
MIAKILAGTIPPDVCLHPLFIFLPGPLRLGIFLLDGLDARRIVHGITLEGLTHALHRTESVGLYRPPFPPSLPAEVSAILKNTSPSSPLWLLLSQIVQAKWFFTFPFLKELRHSKPRLQ